MEPVNVPPGIAAIAGIPRIEGLSADQLAESLYDNRMSLDAPPLKRPKWELNEQELQSSVCHKLRMFLWNELFSLQDELSTPQSEIDTLSKRGKIALVKELLALTSPQLQENTGAAGPNLGY